MWMLLALNAVMLAGLLFTLWRLHHLQAVLAVDGRTSRQAVKPGERRREPFPPRRSPLDEFPSETSLEEPLAPPQPTRRPQPAGGRSSHRLAPVGR